MSDSRNKIPGHAVESDAQGLDSPCESLEAQTSLAKAQRRIRSPHCATCKKAFRC